MSTTFSDFMKLSHVEVLLFIIVVLTNANSFLFRALDRVFRQSVIEVSY